MELFAEMVILNLICGLALQTIILLTPPCKQKTIKNPRQDEGSHLHPPPFFPCSHLCISPSLCFSSSERWVTAPRNKHPLFPRHVSYLRFNLSQAEKFPSCVREWIIYSAYPQGRNYLGKISVEISFILGHYFGSFGRIIQHQLAYKIATFSMAETS